MLAALWTAIDGKGEPPTPEALAALYPPEWDRPDWLEALRMVDPEAQAPPGLTAGEKADAPPARWGRTPTAFRTVYGSDGPRLEAPALGDRGHDPGVPPGGPRRPRPSALWEVSRRWLGTDPDTRPPHPLAPIIEAWRDRPPVVHAERRPDPILPVATVRETPEREAGRLAFGGLYEAGDHADAQLPLLPAPDGPRVALLELVDVSGVPTMARGRGAPLALRLAVAVALGVPQTNRGRAR